MPRPDPRKRRTREHVIADQCRVHVESLLIDAGFTAEQTAHDYGYDLYVTTYDADGYIEPGLILIQLKATDSIERGETETTYAHQLDCRDYRLWTQEGFPVYLILFDARRRQAFGLHMQSYFRDDPLRRPKPEQKSIRVRVPKSSRVDHNFITAMRSTRRPLASGE